MKCNISRLSLQNKGTEMRLCGRGVRKPPGLIVRRRFVPPWWWWRPQNALMTLLLFSCLAPLNLGSLSEPLHVALYTHFGTNSSKIVQLHLFPPDMPLGLPFQFSCCYYGYCFSWVVYCKHEIFPTQFPRIFLGVVVIKIIIFFVVVEESHSFAWHQVPASLPRLDDYINAFSCRSNW